jgi:uncharacterized membrane protein
MKAMLSRPGTGRLEAFSDGVIAIALTLMVLELRPPGRAIDHESVTSLANYLTPKLTVYILSFAIIAKLWVSHHHLLEAAAYASSRLMWLNMVLLFWMSLIPFVTGYLSEDPSRPLAVATYGIVLFFNVATFTVMRHHVISALLKPGYAAHPYLLPVSFAGMAMYAVGAVMAYVSIPLSFVLFVLVPLLSMLGDRYQRLTENGSVSQQSSP